MGHVVVYLLVYLCIHMFQVTEPYSFIYDRDDGLEDEDVPLARHLYKSYSPILLV